MITNIIILMVFLGLICLLASANQRRYNTLSARISGLEERLAALDGRVGENRLLIESNKENIQKKEQK